MSPSDRSVRRSGRTVRLVVNQLVDYHIGAATLARSLVAYVAEAMSPPSCKRPDFEVFEFLLLLLFLFVRMLFLEFDFFFLFETLFAFWLPFRSLVFVASSLFLRSCSFRLAFPSPFLRDWELRSSRVPVPCGLPACMRPRSNNFCSCATLGSNSPRGVHLRMPALRKHALGGSVAGRSAGFGLCGYGGVEGSRDQRCGHLLRDPGRGTQ